MSERRMGMSGYRTAGVFAVVGCLVLGSMAWAGDAVTDAKRKAASDLMKEGKTNDAIAMISEVIKVDPENYRDHLLLARAYDKLNKSQEAVEEYRRMLELPGGSEDRAAKTEAERRLKVLDAQTAKIQALEEEMLKKLDVLEREAIGARDMRALQQIFTLRGGIWNARGRKEGFGVDLPANAEWLDSCAIVKKGVTYRVRAAGIWTINGTVSCTADGSRELPALPTGPYGCLHAAVVGGYGYYQLGSDCTFTPNATGRLTVTTNVNTKPERDRSTGSLYILITPVPANAKN